MDAEERRTRIYKRLTEDGRPLTGTSLAHEFGVSRQVIVGDIAILRATGLNIYATPQGYLVPFQQQAKVVSKVACIHKHHKLEQELMIMVEEGAVVQDVIVEHPIYGEIKANLMLETVGDVRNFIEKLRQTQAEPLSTITGGVHLHTLAVSSEDRLERIKSKLRSLEILVE